MHGPDNAGSRSSDGFEELEWELHKLLGEAFTAGVPVRG